MNKKCENSKRKIFNSTKKKKWNGKLLMNKLCLQNNKMTKYIGNEWIRSYFKMRIHENSEIGENNNEILGT